MPDPAGQRPPRPPSRSVFAAPAVLGPLLLLLVALWFGSQFRQVEQARGVIRASYERRLVVRAFLRVLDDAESAQRGYVITADPLFLSTYRHARAEASDRLGRLDRLAAAEPGAARRVAPMRAAIGAKFAEMDDVIARRRQDGFQGAAARVSDRQGIALMQRVRQQTFAFEALEERLLATRLTAQQDRYRGVERLVWALMAAAVLALWIALWLLWRSRRSRYRTEREAYAAAVRLRFIFASTTDGMLIFDAAGRVDAANAAAARMAGVAPKELVGRDVSALLDIADGSGPFADRIGLGEDQRLSQPLRLDRTIRHRDGHALPVDIAMGTMPLAEGTYIVASLRDISERKAVERLKDEFVSTVSHELRTPLTSVVGSLGLLRAGAVGELPDAARRLVDIADNNARRLIRLINDILDIEKIGSGRMHFEMRPVDVQEVAAAAIDNARSLARGQEVELALDADAAVMALGDGDRLRQVIDNLLANAIRFSPPGSTVRLTLEREEREARVTVDDEGPGVPIEFRGRIFGRFAQAGDKSGQGGSGLGLAISREIVTAHHGRIWFGDAPGGGARFVFTVPLAAPVAEEVRPARPRVLLCEGQASAATDIRALLEAGVCEVDTVADAAAAERAARSGRYDALILDVGEHDGDGLEAVRTLRRGNETRLLPIILLSPDGATVDDAAQVPALDLIDWIDKPVDQGRLVQAVRRAVSRSAVTRPTLLHVDDDLDMLEVAATALADQGRVLRATTVAAARDLLSRMTPDVVILDVALPDGSGLELLPDIARHGDGTIPTIVYSASDVRPDVGRQVDAVLIKSRRSLPNLAKAIRRVLAESASSEET